jgi:hypothetical protein
MEDKALSLPGYLKAAGDGMHRTKPFTYSAIGTALRIGEKRFGFMHAQGCLGT